jgi:hypothetical protein
MQKQLHLSAANREARCDELLRPFCGWGLLYLWPGSLKPFEQNVDSHFVFRVLVGRVELELGDGFERPQCMEARFGDTVVVRPLNYYGMRNTSVNSCAVLFYMHSHHVPEVC